MLVFLQCRFFKKNNSRTTQVSFIYARSSSYITSDTIWFQTTLIWYLHHFYSAHIEYNKNNSFCVFLADNSSIISFNMHFDFFNFLLRKHFGLLFILLCKVPQMKVLRLDNSFTNSTELYKLFICYTSIVIQLQLSDNNS